jgi:hypothetical protein
MKSNYAYLFAAYAVTWIIHITYLGDDRIALCAAEA